MAIQIYRSNRCKMGIGHEQCEYVARILRVIEPSKKKKNVCYAVFVLRTHTARLVLPILSRSALTVSVWNVPHRGGNVPLWSVRGTLRFVTCLSSISWGI